MEKTGEMIHVVMCFNDGVLRPAEVAIVSAVRHCSQPVAVHICSSGLGEASVDELRRVCERCGAAEVSFHFHGLDQIRCRPSNPNIPMEAYLTCCIPSVFPELSQVVYLDADVLVNGDLAELSDEGSKHSGDWLVLGADCTAGFDGNHLRRIGLSAGDVYINNGVMILDLDRMRREDTVTRFFEVANSRGSELPFMDQDVLNIVIKGRIGIIPVEWNCTTQELQRHPALERQAKIIHYTGVPKPWHGYGWRGYREYLWNFESRLVSRMIVRKAKVDLNLIPSESGFARFRLKGLLCHIISMRGGKLLALRYADGDLRRKMRESWRQKIANWYMNFFG